MKTDGARVHEKEHMKKEHMKKEYMKKRLTLLSIDSIIVLVQ